MKQFHPDKVRKFWPVAALLLAGSIMSALSGLTNGLGKLISHVLTSSAEFEVCSGSLYCLDENRRLVSHLEDLALQQKRFAGVVKYQITFVGQDPCEPIGTVEVPDGSTELVEEALSEIWLIVDDKECSANLVRFLDFEIQPIGAALGTLFYRLEGDFVVGAGPGGLILLTKN